ALAQQLARAGVMTLHAAGIATPSGGIIAIGRKGAGKSTLTASALQAGFRVVSDDWLLAAFEGNGLRVQRMRRFMMLRKGWATDQLRKFLPDEFLTESKTRPRLHVFLPEDDARFPAHCHVDRIFVLERGRSGRPERTRSEPLPAAVALGALTEASMPIVLSQKLPVERDCLLPGLTRLLSQASHSVHGGTDLIAEHESAWETLRCPVAGSSTVDPTPERC
ncbi:MAG: hypothetical protein GVY36_02690, partial [Verrucomicrobia bacterium]|nr:hypothetical protein [Verrucomicrobiota bacterium]